MNPNKAKTHGLTVITFEVFPPHTKTSNLFYILYPPQVFLQTFLQSLIKKCYIPNNTYKTKFNPPKLFMKYNVLFSISCLLFEKHQ